MPDNYTVSEEGEDIVIRISKNHTPVRSSTGKMMLLASSHGWAATTVQMGGKPIALSLNIGFK